MKWRLVSLLAVFAVLAGGGVTACTVSPSSPSGCYDGADIPNGIFGVSHVRDVRFVGPWNRPDNVLMYDSTDGTCNSDGPTSKGIGTISLTWVIPAAGAAAFPLCDEIAPSRYQYASQLALHTMFPDYADLALVDAYQCDPLNMP